MTWGDNTFPQYDDPCTFRVLVDNWPIATVSKFFQFLGFAAAMCDSSNSNQNTMSSSTNDNDAILTISIVLSCICLLLSTIATIGVGFGYVAYRDITKRMSSKVHASDQLWRKSIFFCIGISNTSGRSGVSTSSREDVVRAVARVFVCRCRYVGTYVMCVSEGTEVPKCYS